MSKRLNLLALSIIVLSMLMISGCADSISIGGAYLKTDIHGQQIQEVMPIVMVNFKL